MYDLAYKYRSEENLVFLRRSHYHIELPVLLDFEYRLNRQVMFLFDTGAYVTVINKETSLLLGFNN